MIRGYIPGFSMPNKETRYGDAQIISDGKYQLVIDGYMGEGTTKLINYMKKWKIKKPYLAISHAHYDHTYGIRKIINDDYFTPRALYCYDPNTLRSGLRNNRGSNEVKSDIASLENIIREAKNRNIPVNYLKHGDNVSFGEIKFIVYREQPSKVYDDDTEGWAYVNDGSLCFWFPELRYWTSGDGCESMYEMCRKTGAKPLFFKIPHHGNNCNNTQAKGLKAMGAKYAWYNDLEPDGIGTCGFTAYGARRCVQNGIKVFTTVGDLNFIAQNGKMEIYKDGQIYQLSIPYKGKSTLKSPSVDVVRNVFMNKYGKSNTRTTNLICYGYYPYATQKKVNAVVDMAKNIISGKVNYGKNEERLAKVDAKMGIGYGQLVQDEINSLLNAKSKKW